MLKKTKKFGIGKFLVMAMVLGGGLVYGSQMVQKNQDNRSSAASKITQTCRCSKSVYKTASLCIKAKGNWVCPEITTKPTATPVSKKTCTTGQKLCKGNVSMICKNNTWVVFKTCGDGCGNGECIPKVTTPSPVKKVSVAPIRETKCTSVMYTTWSPCKDGKQTRTIWEKNPSGCTVENPVLSQSCSTI